MRKKFLFAFFAGLLTLTLLAGCGGSKTAEKKADKTTPEAAKTNENTAGPQFGPPAPGPKPGEKAPAFKLAELNSRKEMAFPEDFQGKKVALLFFSPG